MKILQVLLFCCISICAHAQVKNNQLDEKLNAIYKTSKITGFGVSIFTSDQILYQKGFGYADKETKKVYSENTVQNIGSVSKTFIGIALMKAIEEGKLTVDTPINKILPLDIHHPRYPQTPILVKHLATHTSSILDADAYEKSYVLEEKVALSQENYTKKELKELKALKSNQTYSLEAFLKNYLTLDGEWYEKKNFSKHQPGKRFEYSNVGSALLAYVIEIATGVSFPEYTQQHILDPLSMKDSGWSYESVDPSKYASVYTEAGNKIPRYHLCTYPDGGFRSSIKDLSKYLQGLMKGYYGEDAILNTSSFQQMMSPQLTKDQLNTKKETKDNYGFFWEVTTAGKMGHNGSDPGILTLMYFNKKDKIGAIFFMNTGLEEDQDILKSVRSIWKEVKQYKSEYSKSL
ncbi:serine hydrolase domain-containing protein [Aquimarina litoralis]|uniref:serine hydrolase domain-containing protein n=1 Tax=Aquimarina litoralis TaxID=584605 RepID=UPI001C57EB51|nr:serine hydrolase domain-containing protein [Aquimarina litoralis]MBW1296587.1 serine hydrolase [Aquimarina litoralis]